MAAAPASSASLLRGAPLRCAGRQLLVDFQPEQVIVHTGKESLHLALAISASGSRFASSNSADELWIKGKEAMLTINGKMVRCHFARSTRRS